MTWHRDNGSIKQNSSLTPTHTKVHTVILFAVLLLRNVKCAGGGPVASPDG